MYAVDAYIVLTDFVRATLGWLDLTARHILAALVVMLRRGTVGVSSAIRIHKTQDSAEDNDDRPPVVRPPLDLQPFLLEGRTSQAPTRLRQGPIDGDGPLTGQPERLSREDRVTRSFL